MTPPVLARAATDGSGEETHRVISVRGLRMSYGDREAVKGIDLDVHRGEIVAVVGPNGAGKTTTLEILEGFRRRTAGEVAVLGVDPEDADAAWRARVGVVLQLSEPERHLTVEQCLSLYAGYYSNPRPVDATLDLMGLRDRAGVRGGRLSGGERRRMDVALALIGDPELLFLDEPTTGFDPSARRDAWHTIADLRALGKTVVLSTHQMDEAEALADRIVVLSDGRIAAEGPPRSLGGRDRAPTRIQFTLPAGATAEGLAAAFADRLASDDGRISIDSDAPLEDLERLGGWARQRGVRVEDLSVRRPSLEDVYLGMTGGTS